MTSQMSCIHAVIAAVIAASVHPSVAVPGVGCARGCLTQYSCPASARANFDPDKPTIVITHGFNPAIRHMRMTTDSAYAHAILSRFGNRFNVLGWNWNAATRDGLTTWQFANMAIWQGHLLACRLKEIGVRPEKTWLIGHSFGAIVMSKAAQEMACECGRPVAQLTMLDAVWFQHRIIFRWFEATCNAACVENYWAGRRSGLGKPARFAGVYNCRVPDRVPWVYIFNPYGTHAYSVEWYYNSIRCPRCCDGFNRGLRCFVAKCGTASATCGTP
jgi:pimeloyl-ACP methyl ester carboxylesterase